MKLSSSWLLLAALAALLAPEAASAGRGCRRACHARFHGGGPGQIVYYVSSPGATLTNGVACGDGCRAR